MNHRLAILIKQQQERLFDLNLTPENAEEFGYKHVEDVNYDLFEKNYCLKDFLQILEKLNTKLGNPLKPYNFSTFVGVYVPISN